MMKRNTIWIIGAILLVAALLFLPGLLYGGNMMAGGYGMMGNNYGMGGNFMDQGAAGYGGWTDCRGAGYGMMGGGSFLGWLIPIALLTLVVTAGVWLGNALSKRSLASASAAPAQTCQSCSKPVSADWQTCPYCGNSLE